MRPLKQKVEQQNTGAPWLEPDLAYQVPGTSWHPLDPPPPFQNLPKIKKHIHKVNLGLLAISPENVQNPLSSTSSIVREVNNGMEDDYFEETILENPNGRPDSVHPSETRRLSNSRIQAKARSESFDFENTPLNPEDMSPNPDWKQQTLIFKQPLTPSDPDNVFKQHAAATGSSKSKALAIKSWSGYQFSEDNASPAPEDEAKSPTPSPAVSAPLPVEKEKQLFIKFRRNITSSDKNGHKGSKASKTGSQSTAADDNVSSPELTSASSVESPSSTDDEYRASAQLKSQKIAKRTFNTRRQSKDAVKPSPTITITKKRVRSPSPTPVADVTPVKKKRGRKPKKAKYVGSKVFNWFSTNDFRLQEEDTASVQPDNQSALDLSMVNTFLRQPFTTLFIEYWSNFAFRKTTTSAPLVVTMVNFCAAKVAPNHFISTVSTRLWRQKTFPRKLGTVKNVAQNK